MAHKTKQAALKAAREALGPEAVEGIDFNLHNTGAGWTHEAIPPVTTAAKEARAKKAKPSAAAKRVKAMKTAAMAKPAKPEESSKSDTLTAMLKRREGATAQQMMQATGWVNHSIHGFISTLKRKGEHVTAEKTKGKPTVYRIGRERATKAAAGAQIGDVV